ncbi:hypothetical protein MLD38_040090 [Melastoma candidum]|uniref:Uncharacterized protein n=1 Tax=Melastoma candidum TaxID=119954 RepID=A0ACB9L4X7_9MYRT|nr:hypothetical protein MLD38_040090 [Melastoma candidum]
MTMSRLSLSLSYNLNLTLASIVSLLLVVLFVLLLHVYAKWLLLRARRRSRIARRTASLPGFPVMPSASFDSLPTEGLDPSLIASIPIFLYRRDPGEFGLECVICLSHFEEDEVGRSLAKCGHAFHMECIDMWLHSHTTCPICRAPAASTSDVSQETNKGEAASGVLAGDETRGVRRDWEAVIDVLEGEEGSNMVSGGEEEEGREVVSVVMDVFIVSVSVG